MLPSPINTGHTEIRRVDTGDGGAELDHEDDLAVTGRIDALGGMETTAAAQVTAATRSGGHTRADLTGRQLSRTVDSFDPFVSPAHRTAFANSAHVCTHPH